MNEKFCISIRISLRFVPKGPIDNKSALVQVMVCCRTGIKPSPEPDWFSVWCLGPLMYHLAVVWWFTFRFMFLNGCCVQIWYGADKFCIDFAFIRVFMIYVSFTYQFSSQMTLLWNSFVNWVCCTGLFHRHSLYFFIILITQNYLLICRRRAKIKAHLPGVQHLMIRND